MKRQVFLILSLLGLSIRADPEKEASALFEQHPGFPATKESLEGALRDKAPEYIDVQPSKTLQELSTIFEENRDKGQKDLDPIRSLLGTQIKTQERAVRDKNSPAPNLSEVEGLLNRKHRYRLSVDDPVFLGQQKIIAEKSKQDKDNPIIEQAKAKFESNADKRSQDSFKEAAEETFTCREGATGTLQSCVKRLVLEAVPQEPIIKNVTAYFTARCYNLVSFNINLKTGHIHVWQCENPGPRNLAVTNPIGEPELPLETRIELIARQHFGEGGVDFRTSQMTPSVSNGFTASFTAFQPKTGKKHEGNKNHVRGGQYTWRVTLPRKPKLIARWEGCEDLERKQEAGACTLGESIQKYINESCKVEGFPDLVKQDFWEEERQYLCGFGSDKNDCEKLIQQGCEQIDSKCVVEKGGVCLEFEQTYHCGKSGFQASSALPPFEEPYRVDKKQSIEQYNLADFGLAMTHFNALKEMSAEMKDGLGGIGGTPTDPTIFHGRCDRCTIKGGKFIQDCCNLKGILQNMLGGGCRESEKLATAHLREKRCHLVQKRYCTHHIKLGLAKVCVEWKDAYCCYGSELARIIQEIAHDDPQQAELRAYNSAQGIETGWGTGASPNCQSLTASQLSLINFDTPFAQHHLGQLFKTFEQQAESKFKAFSEKAESSEGMLTRAKRASDGLKRHFSATHKDRPQSSFRESSK